jgi:hypothetical protein
LRQIAETIAEEPTEAESAFALAAAVALADDEGRGRGKRAHQSARRVVRNPPDRSAEILDQLDEDQASPASKD